MEAHYRRENWAWTLCKILTAEQLTVVRLIFVEDLNQAEAAREIGLTQQMVSVLLQQAKARVIAAGIRPNDSHNIDLIHYKEN